MTQVCIEQFPKGTKKYQKQDGFFMDPVLKAQLDILLKNIKDDWEFTILVAGGGEVRVGKSVLAIQIGAYWTQQMKELYGKEVPFNVAQNICFEGRELIKKGNFLGKNYPYSCLLYDEAGADLEGRKVVFSTTKAVLDYFRECGQYNQLNIIVLPEFFDLPKGIALSRSIFLINVYYIADAEGRFERGFFDFFSRRNKKKLYIKGKKDLNYHAAPYNFHGRFYNFYPVDEQEYRKAKQEALSRRDVGGRRAKWQLQRDASWYLLCHEGLTCPECNKQIKIQQNELAKMMHELTGFYTTKQNVQRAIAHYNVETEVGSELAEDN